MPLAPLALLFALDAITGPARATTPAQVGQPAPDFSLGDTDGSVVQLSALRGKVVVLEWFNPDCPFVKHAYDTGLIPSLASSWLGKGVVWLSINSGAPGKQGHGAPRNAQARADWHLSWPVLLDPSGVVGQAYGARTTPQLFIVDPAGTLVYAGGLDNAPLGQVDGGSRMDYISAALSEVTGGAPVTTATSKPYGCSVKYGG